VSDAIAVQNVAAIEAAGYDTWTADETTEMAGWTLYSNGGFTRRVNCATASGSPPSDPDTRGVINEWLSKRGGRPVVRVTPQLSASTIKAITDWWGYAAVDETVVMAKSTGSCSSPEGVQVVECDDPDFLSDVVELNQRPDSSFDAWGRMMTRVTHRAAGLWVASQAVGLVVKSGEFAAVYSVAVAPEHRRKGLARAVMDAADVWAAERGCTTSFLQVVGNNQGGLALYETLGFTEVYRYHYLEPATEA
jgi:ribosomal protein S18 acetylase RimI-like enzyme